MRHRSQQDEDRAPDVADDRFEQRHDADGERAVALVLLPDARGNHVHVRLRGGHRHAALHARHHVVVLVAAPVDRVRAERKRQEHVHLRDARNRRHDLGVQQEVRPQDAGDRELVLGLAGAFAHAVEGDAPPDDVRIRPEEPRPERVAEDHDRRLPRRVFFGKQEPPVQRPGAQQLEEARRRSQGLHALRLLEPEQRAGATAGDRHLVERPALVPDVDVLPGRRPVLRDVDPRGSQPQDREPIGFGIWKRLEQQRVDHAEDRRVGADADRERGHDDERQSPASPEGANRIPDVLNEGRHRRILRC